MKITASFCVGVCHYAFVVARYRTSYNLLVCNLCSIYMTKKWINFRWWGPKEVPITPQPQKSGIFYCRFPAPSVSLGKLFQFCIFRLIVPLGGQVGESRIIVSWGKSLNFLGSRFCWVLKWWYVLPRASYAHKNFLAEVQVGNYVTIEASSYFAV